MPTSDKNERLEEAIGLLWLIEGEMELMILESSLGNRPMRCSAALSKSLLPLPGGEGGRQAG